jgi:hypothetical protein
VAILVALPGVGVWLLATNTADESDPSSGGSITEPAV